jgi:PrgI family protein
MATYTLIQDIEAEDHILGPLTLRQFIFALIACFFFYLCFLSVVKHVVFLLILFLPPALFFGFFAIPFGRDQPTEVWALGKIRFWLKPRKRIWDQSGVKELVTINVPKKVERVLTNGLNQYEVQSRLQALATTLDSHGWAIKDIPSATAAEVYVSNFQATDSDRLIDVNTLPKEVPEDVTPQDADILNEDTSPVAQHLNNMINKSTKVRRQQLLKEMRSQPGSPPQSPAASQWFMPGTNSGPMPTAAVPIAQDEIADESALGAKLKANRSAQEIPYRNLHTLQPLGSQVPVRTRSAVAAQSSSTLTPQPDPAIISLANNDDFTVATIARQAKKAKDDKSDDEVVISLH